MNRIDFIMKTFCARARTQTTEFDPEELMDSLSRAWDRLEMEVKSMMDDDDCVGDDEIEACSSEKVPMGFHQPKVKAKACDEEEEPEEEDEEIDTTVVCKARKTSKPRTTKKTAEKPSQE
jgi:hypothetical protein